MVNEAATIEQHKQMPLVERRSPISLKDVGQVVVDHVIDLRDSADWRVAAACRGIEDIAAVFFPPNHFERKDEKLDRERLAKDICGSCAVRSECLDYAVRAREPHGVWGGLNEKERQQILPPRTRR